MGLICSEQFLHVHVPDFLSHSNFLPKTRPVTSWDNSWVAKPEAAPSMPRARPPSDKSSGQITFHLNRSLLASATVGRSPGPSVTKSPAALGISKLTEFSCEPTVG